MKASASQLVTPVYLKTEDSFPWPEKEPVFHLLTRDGLFLCRNHPFFRSSIPVGDGPSELANHETSLQLHYPVIPRELFERVVGFFARVGESSGAESAVLFAWNREKEKVDLVIPEQSALVGHDVTGKPYPINVWYDVPPLPDHLVVFGDAHCHVDGPAYASKTDVDDETDRPGLHIVVGRIDREPPELHIDVTVDKARFHLTNPGAVLEGYEKRRTSEVPDSWLEKVVVIPWEEYATRDAPTDARSITPDPSE